MTRTALLGGLVLLQLLASVTPAAKRAEDALVPAPERQPALGLDGSTWIGSGPGYGLRLTALSERERLAFVEATTGSRTDPFATRPDERPRFLTFLLELDNASSQDLVFNSQNCWLVTNRKEILYPTGIERLSSDYQQLERELPPAYARAATAVFESSVTLAPGARLRGLLIYPQVRPGTKSYNVELQLTLGSGDVARIVAPYKRPAKTKGKR